MSANRMLHDWLLEHKPEAASHDTKECPFCTEGASTQEEDVAEDKIFTQEQHEQLLASAIERAVTEATAKVDGEILRLNEQAEAAEKELTERDEKIAELEKAIADREEQDRLEALASERAKLVRAAANFSDEQIEARRESWAKMSEEDFNTYLEDIQEVAKASTDTKKKVPESKLDGTRETAGEGGTEKSVIESFFSTGAIETAAQL